MTNDDKKELKALIKEGTVEALISSEGQDAIAKALTTEKGQNAIVAALATEKGQNTIAEALTTEKAKDAILDVFVEAFHEVVVPVFEDQNSRIKRLEEVMGVVA